MLPCFAFSTATSLICSCEVSTSCCISAKGVGGGGAGCGCGGGRGGGGPIPQEREDEDDEGASLLPANILASAGARSLHCRQALTARSCVFWSAAPIADLTSSSLAKESAKSIMELIPSSSRQEGAATPSVDWSTPPRTRRKVDPDPPMCPLNPPAGLAGGTVIE